MALSSMNEAKISSTILQTLKAGTPGSNHILMPGCKIMLVTFASASGVDVNYIEFCNRYTGTVVISAKHRIHQPGGNIKFEWKRLLTKTLMPNPHHASGAESKFVIKSSELMTEPKSISALRFVLQQPSVNFTEFAIENLKVVSSEPSTNSSDSLTQWLLKGSDGDIKKHTTAIRDFPHLEKVSLGLQRMWALGKKSNSIAYDSNQPRRFDIDGCYDINLLTY